MRIPGSIKAYKILLNVYCKNSTAVYWVNGNGIRGTYFEYAFTIRMYICGTSAQYTYT